MELVNQLAATRYGIMLYNKNDTVIGTNLELYGEWSQSELDFLAPHIPHNGCCIDIGANIGTHTLFFANAVGPDGCVIAFEPQHPIFQILCANVALNQHLNVLTCNVAVSDLTRVLHFPNINYRRSNNYGAFTTRGDGYQVQGKALDDYGFASVDLIKIDVEGAEPEVIIGGAKTIHKHRPLIYVEYHPTEHSQNLIKLIQDFDYDVYLHFANAFNPNNFKKQANDLHQGYRETNLFCVSRSKNLSVDLPKMERWDRL